MMVFFFKQKTAYDMRISDWKFRRVLFRSGDAMESQELRRAGLKVTHPRMRILELLEQRSAHHHMTAEDIYRHLLDSGDEIGLATVYRVLTQFEAAGLVLKHNFEGEIGRAHV